MKRQNLTPFNDKGQSHSLWINYTYNGYLRYKGQYVNGIQHGYWIGNWTMSKSKITFFIK